MSRKRGESASPPPPRLYNGDTDTPEFQERLEVLYAETRKGTPRIRAAVAAGIRYGSLNSWLDPRHAQFKQAVYDGFHEARAHWLATIELKLQKGLQLAEDNEEADVLIRGALSVLERLNKSEWSRQESRVVEGKVEHIHTHQLAEVRRVALLEASLIGQQLLGAGDVVDAEVVKREA